MMQKTKGDILIIDDDLDVLESARIFLEEYHQNIHIISDPNLINQHLNKSDIDVVLLDMNFRKGAVDGKEGIYWLKHIKEIRPQTSVILLTAFGDIDLAVEVMKQGAFDFIQKPWSNSKLLASVNAALKLKRSADKVQSLTEVNDKLSNDLNLGYTEIIGQSPQILQLKETISKVAETDANVLLLGENGTGKDLIAQEIHRKSKRCNEIFIRVDLGSLSENLFESELFGYIKGAFTDASTDKAGRFELANKGTIFLDEIGNLSTSLQAKILSVLQNRVVYRLGSAKEVKIDVRLICATNQPLKQAVHDGIFREDLYYRINTFELTIPALRDRSSDIPLLFGHFLKQFAQKYQKGIPQISAKLLNKIMNYSWPGNIRELQNSVERALILNTGQMIELNDLFNDFSLVSISNEEVFNLEELEKRTILKVIKNNNGNITNSAQELGIHRNALYRRLEKYGL